MEEMVVNGKTYPLWGQFVNRKNEWIGGTLYDGGDSFDRIIGLGKISTKITDIELKPNGDESAYFQVNGENFSCGFDVKYGGITGGSVGETDRITFSGYMGHTWSIAQPKKRLK